MVAHAEALSAGLHSLGELLTEQDGRIRRDTRGARQQLRAQMDSAIEGDAPSRDRPTAPAEADAPARGRRFTREAEPVMGPAEGVSGGPTSAGGLVIEASRRRLES